MKNLPALVSLAALAALLFLAAVSFVFDSVPFVLIASYIVGSACSLGVVGLFLGDYTTRTPQLDLSPEKIRSVRREARELVPLVPLDLMSTLGLRRDPATISRT